MLIPKNNKLLYHNDIYIVIQPKMFADIGGTGNTYWENNSCVLLDKGSYVFNDYEINDRYNFQCEFSKLVNCF